MRCPFCGSQDTHVLDSRPSDEKIRRRRACSTCEKRFTTYECVESPILLVWKRDNSLEAFDRNKLITGIFNAIKKRPVTREQVEYIADVAEQRCTGTLNETVSSIEIGNTVMEQLKKIDAVAYIRFASVYQDFTDVEGFIAAISALHEQNE